MSSRGENLGVAYGRALDRFKVAEARMLRAFHAYEKARAALLRAEKRLDEASRIDGSAESAPA